MELFSELYSTYFRAVESVLRCAQKSLLTQGDIQRILSKHAFSESVFYIQPKLEDGAWPLLEKCEDGYEARHPLNWDNPLTTLQKSWLKALLADQRIRLFLEEEDYAKLCAELSDVEPLFRQQDFHIFDQAVDGDEYESQNYQSVFKSFMAACRQNLPLSIGYESGKGARVRGVFWPKKMEYSAKDDKFRAHCVRRFGGKSVPYILNLARVEFAYPVEADSPPPLSAEKTDSLCREVVMEITQERNALERCMVHFAHFEKRTEYDEETDKYTCTLQYNIMDEMEVMIRVLSFGPTVKVLGPESFLSELRQRVDTQTRLLQDEKAAKEDA